MAEETKNYVLAESYNRANIQKRLWYVMGAADLDALKDEEKILFGDKAFAINEKQLYIMGNDGNWYEIPVALA